MAGLVIDNLVKTVGASPILRNVSLEIADGEFLTLLGPSGCGKSTLLRILAGLDAQNAGSVTIDGRPVDGLRPKQRDIAMVFQSYALYPHMTVADNLALPLRMRRLSSWQRLPLIGRLLPGARAQLGGIEEDVRRTAAALGIGHLLDRKPGQLSGGQRQRVALGRAMVRRPAVFLMDEPLSNLDAKLRLEMRAEIKDLHRRLGVTFIYVTHDQAEAMTLSDRVAVMVDGTLLQVAPPQEIYADPQDRRVAEFIGAPAINLIEARLRQPGLAEAAGTNLSLGAGMVGAGQRGAGTTAGAGLTIGIRPEGFFPAHAPGLDVLSGPVRLVEHMGADLFVSLTVPGQERPVVARLSTERAGHVAAGQILHLGVRPDSLLLFAPDGQRMRPKPGGHIVALKERSR